jgi:hypothetical protein
VTEKAKICKNFAKKVGGPGSCGEKWSIENKNSFCRFFFQRPDIFTHWSTEKPMATSLDKSTDSFILLQFSTGFHRNPVSCYLAVLDLLMTDVLPTVCHSASIWLTLMLAVQRYIYVCHPGKARIW